MESGKNGSPLIQSNNGVRSSQRRPSPQPKPRPTHWKRQKRRSVCESAALKPRLAPSHLTAHLFHRHSAGAAEGSARPAHTSYTLYFTNRRRFNHFLWSRTSSRTWCQSGTSETNCPNLKTFNQIFDLF